MENRVSGKEKKERETIYNARVDNKKRIVMMLMMIIMGMIITKDENNR